MAELEMEGGDFGMFSASSFFSADSISPPWLLFSVSDPHTFPKKMTAKNIMQFVNTRTAITVNTRV